MTNNNLCKIIASTNSDQYKEMKALKERFPEFVIEITNGEFIIPEEWISIEPEE